MALGFVADCGSSVLWSLVASSTSREDGRAWTWLEEPAMGP